MQVQLQLLKGGHCTHKEKMVWRKGQSKTVAFPSMFALIEHPTEGPILFDTGYSEAFFSATQRFPERLYRLLTPVNLRDSESARAQLQARGYKAEDVKWILISHFHGDHIAGLRDFPRARMVFLSSGYDYVRPLQGFRATRIGYLPALLPEDFESRALPLSLNSKQLMQNPPEPFALAYDLFRDGSILLIPLEGHFCGQMGALVQTAAGQVFLIADACWYRESFEKLEMPHPVAMRIMYKAKEYREDLIRIQRFAQLNPQTPVIPSHCTRSIDHYMQHSEYAL